MVRGAGRLDVKCVSVADIERACRDPRNIRVGATVDPLSRAREYEQRGANGHFFVGTFLYVRASNALAAEDRLLYIARQYGRGVLNCQWRSNYPDGQHGYV